MYSLHKFKQQQKLKANSEHRLKILHDPSKSPLTITLANSFKNRLKKHSKGISQDQLNRIPQTVIRNGSVPLIPTSNHSFRTDCKCSKISAKNYLKSEERAQKCVDDYKSSHLEAEKYSDKKINVRTCSSNASIRDKKYLKLRQTLQESLARIQKNINLNILYTTEPLDVRKIENPVFRDVDKTKWKGKAFRRGSFKIEDDLYKHISDPYEDHCNLFETLFRKREKSKELDQFKNTFARDTWNKLVPRPVSNATYLSIARSKSIINSTKIYVHSLGL